MKEIWKHRFGFVVGLRCLTNNVDVEVEKESWGAGRVRVDGGKSAKCAAKKSPANTDSQSSIVGQLGAWILTRVTVN